MNNPNYISEPRKKIPVFDRCDVLVVGGGPAGCAAATSAGRMGADVLILERYGSLGGLSTGGLVAWIDRMTDWTGRPVIQGFAENLLSRIPEERKIGPEKAFWGSRDAERVEYWENRSSAQHGIVNWSPTVDPEALKKAYLEIVLDANVRLVFHAWAVSAVLDGDTVLGVIFESKSGRQAVLAKSIIDATGDGDIFHFAGAPYENDSIRGDSHSRINVSFILGGLDMRAYFAFKKNQPDEFSKKWSAQKDFPGGFPIPYVLPGYNSALFMGPRYPDYSALDIRDLTEVEVRSRRDAEKVLEFYQKEFPGFEKAFLLMTAPQIGVRHSRRVTGAKKMTMAEVKKGIIQPDEIAVSPSLSPDIPNVSVPMGCLIPRGPGNLVVPGRSLSCDAGVHTFMREIPQCWSTGQAAGVLAALSVKNKTPIQNLHYRKVKSELIEQGVHLQ